METLKFLFGSDVKVKIMRLFMFNPQVSFLPKEISEKTLSSTSLSKKELNCLFKAGLIKKKIVSKEIVINKGKKIINKKLKGSGFALNENFPYLDSLKNFMTVASLNVNENFIKRFSGVGQIKLVIVAGVFTQNWDSRVDILIVGNDLNMSKIESIMKVIESEIGKEIAYSAFESSDFEYRLSIHDRLVRDILDYPHITLVDKLGIDPK
jgi:hypothetical protein